MITIKLNYVGHRPNACDECIFCERYPELDYGESMGYDNLDCGLTGEYIGPSYEGCDSVLESCPIVEWKEED